MVFAKIYVTGTCARVTELKKLTSGLTGGEILVDYEDHIWAGLSKAVVFRGIVEKDVLTDKTAVEIPWEVLVKPCKHLWVGFYGTDSDKNMIIPTVYADLGPVLPGADPSGDDSTDPSLPVWAQLQNQIDDLRESGSPGGGGGPGENGGYYTPSVKQPDNDTLQFSFAPSKAGMPDIDPVEVALPAGPKGDDYVLTPDDKTEIAEQAAALVEVPGGGIAVTGATVGQTVKIAAVDENGVPTAWESVDYPSGGGGVVNDNKWEIINELEFAEEGITGFTIDKDKEGKSFELSDMWIVTNSYKSLGGTWPSSARLIVQINGMETNYGAGSLSGAARIYNALATVINNQAYYGFTDFSNNTKGNNGVTIRSVMDKNGNPYDVDSIKSYGLTISNGNGEAYFAVGYKFILWGRRKK